MKLSDKILVVANWLESSDNELLVEGESNGDYLDKLALSLVHAAETLQDVANEIKESEPVETYLTPESLDEMAAIATAFAESEDPLLQKQANVLDEILLTLSAPKDYSFNLKKAEDAKIDMLKKKYKDPHEQLAKNIGTKEALEDIKKSNFTKELKQKGVLSFPLKTRYCPDHPGAPMAHIGDGSWQCSLDNKIYNWETGFTLLDNTKVPGGSINEQTPKFNEESHQIFDNRDSRLGIYRE